jgi:hypothetical protein
MSAQYGAYAPPGSSSPYGPPGPPGGPAFGDAPPPYGAPASAQAAAPNSNVSLDSLLQGYDVILGFDQSGSMSGPVSKKQFNVTRWQSLREAAVTISAAVDHIDPDGATVIFFNSGVSMFDGQKSEDIEAMFRDRKPGGLTDLAGAIRESFSYIKRKVKKDKNYKALIVFVTDGVPYMGDDAVDQGRIVAQLIADFTFYMTQEGLTDDQIGMTIIQIGTDAGATKYLKFLDDSLTIPVAQGGFGAHFDIVDTINFEDVEAAGGIVQAFVRAFND